MKTAPCRRRRFSFSAAHSHKAENESRDKRSSSSSCTYSSVGVHVPVLVRVLVHVSVLVHVLAQKWLAESRAPPCARVVVASRGIAPRSMHRGNEVCRDRNALHREVQSPDGREAGGTQFDNRCAVGSRDGRPGTDAVALAEGSHYAPGEDGEATGRRGPDARGDGRARAVAGREVFARARGREHSRGPAW